LTDAPGAAFLLPQLVAVPGLVIGLENDRRAAAADVLDLLAGFPAGAGQLGLGCDQADGGQQDQHKGKYSDYFFGHFFSLRCEYTF
jgi:hypothetical protein